MSNQAIAFLCGCLASSLALCAALSCLLYKAKAREHDTRMHARGSSEDANAPQEAAATDERTDGKDSPADASDTQEDVVGKADEDETAGREAAEPVEAAASATDDGPIELAAVAPVDKADIVEAADPEPPLDVDMQELSLTLFKASEPLAELRKLVTRIHAAEELAKDGEGPAPRAVASYLARALDEARLFTKTDGGADITIIRPSRSRTFFIRVNDASLSWGGMLRLLAIEGALNRALFCWEQLEESGKADAAELDELEVEDCYRFAQALEASCTAQLGPEPLGHASMTDVAGEWGVRQAIASGIERMRLPLRLTADFRVNLMGGDVAIVAKHVPAAVQPRSVWSDELDRVVPATRQMRERLTTLHALRMVLMLARHAFLCSKRLCHAHVAIVLDSPARHACLVSGDISREALDAYDLTEEFDPISVCRELGVRFVLDHDALMEVPQGFSLDDERFCPRTRYESVDLSQRLLPRFESALLGAERVCDLAINEGAHRSEMAQVVARALGGSTSNDVRTILELCGNDRDATVREAGERCVRALIDGTLNAADHLAFTTEFVDGDALSRAADEAYGLLERGEFQRAVDVLTDVLAPIDALDTYRDGEGYVWREFSSFISRILYNRLEAAPVEAGLLHAAGIETNGAPDEAAVALAAVKPGADGELLAGGIDAEPGEGVTPARTEVRLVPDAYYNAQLLMATALAALDRPAQALGFARRTQELDPYNVSGTLRVVRCLELMGRQADAVGELCAALERAYDPEGLGSAYYRLAFMEWQLGRRDLADACYQKAAVSRASCAAAAVAELKTMRTIYGTKGVEPGEVDDLLAAEGIPLAPTERVANVVVEAAQAATDAEVFPVARSFALLLGALTGDDVMRAVTRSMELEPDR